METILNIGISFILWFQTLGSWPVVPMKFFSFLGSEEFFLVALPLIYWCLDSAVGLRVGLIVLFSGGINEVLKLSMHGPRPYWFSAQVKAYAAETSFGAPSGHAQIATALWGMAAAQIKHRWAWWAAGFVILMIGLSRLFLAVHFPHDVLLGWLIGAFILWGFLRFWDGLAVWIGQKSPGQQIVMAFGLSMMLVVMGLISFGTLRGWVMPTAWLENARRAGVEALPEPVTLKSTMTSAGVLFGMLAGLAWMNSRGGFNASGAVWKRVTRLLPGLVGVLILYIGLSAIFPGGEGFLPYAFRYVRYALIGAWISAGAPWIFQKLGIA